MSISTQILAFRTCTLAPSLALIPSQSSRVVPAYFHFESALKSGSKSFASGT